MKHFVPAFCLLFTAIAFVPAETPGQGAPQAAQTQGQQAVPQPLPGHPPGWVPGGPVPPSPPEITVLRVGGIVDPDTATVAPSQMILVEGEIIREIGPNVAVPPDATVIDLSNLTVLPGMVDAHHHLAMANSGSPNADFYLYYLQNSNPTRTVHAVANAMDMLSAGFTLVRDEGNAGNYIDTALRETIEQGWLPGPTIFNSGIMISGTGGQYGFPRRRGLTPEMWRDRNIVYPEYIEADTPDEIIKAIRQNVMFGAKVIKVIVDQAPYAYTTEEMRIFVSEAAKSGLRVVAHVGTEKGRRAAIEAGVWGLVHAGGATNELLALQAQKGIWYAGTERPLAAWRGSPERLKRMAATLRRAYDARVPLTFSSDGDQNPPGMTRGQYITAILDVWKEARIPNADILRAITINGFKYSEVEHERGPITPGLAADIIGVAGNPLEDIDLLRDVQFVMKDGIVFKRNGLISIAPEKAFRGGHIRRRPVPRPPS